MALQDLTPFSCHTPGRNCEKLISRTVTCRLNSTPSDEDLLLSADPEDFGRFYDRNVHAILGYFSRRTHDPELAADLTAETFAAALVARRRYRIGATPPVAWLFGIAQHKLVDARRRGGARGPHAAPPGHGARPADGTRRGADRAAGT